MFPDTYFFSPLDAPEKILQAFVDRFRKVFTPEMAAEANLAGFTVHEVTTLRTVGSWSPGVSTPIRSASRTCLISWAYAGTLLDRST